MMTAPSTIRPKSSAPRLIRLPLILPCTMPMAVISIESGITSAVISAARKLPSSRNSTTMTSSAPSAGSSPTVPIVASTSSVRSAPSWRRCPAAAPSSDLLDLGVDGGGHGAAVGADQHQRGADDDLVPVLAGAAGAQSRAPIATSARSFMRTGMPPRVATTMLADLAVLDAGRRRARRSPRRCARRSRAAADIVGLQRLDDVGEREAIGDSFVGSGCDVILLDVAADRVDAGDTRHRP